MDEDNFCFSKQFSSLKTIFVGKNNFNESAQQNIYFSSFNINLKIFHGDNMKFDLLEDFNISIKKCYFDEYLNNVMNYSFILPLLLFKFNFDIGNILNNELISLNNILLEKIIEDDSSYLNQYLKMCNFSNENVFKFVLSELTDNIFDHSNSSNAYIFGYCKKEFFDIIIVDDGISIPKSLELHDFFFEHDCDAILSAIKGNSTKNIWGYFERGCGLNNSFSLMTQGGKNSILVASRNGLIYSKKDNIYKKDISNNSIDGTIIGLRFDLSYNFKNLYEIIKNRYDIKED